MLKNMTCTLLLLFLLIGPPCFADDWPQFRGPNRDGVCRETGLLKQWPAEGPELLRAVSEVVGEGKLRDELLNVEIFDTLMETKVLIELWRREYNRYRPHSSLGYKPPAPEAYEIKILIQQVVS